MMNKKKFAGLLLLAVLVAVFTLSSVSAETATLNIKDRVYYPTFKYI